MSLFCHADVFEATSLSFTPSVSASHAAVLAVCLTISFWSNDLIAALGDKVFDTMIPYLTEASNAPRERRSCVSKPGSEIGRAYMAVAKEVLVR